VAMFFYTPTDRKSMFFRINTIDRYILKILIAYIVSISILVIGMVWLSQSLRFLELIINNSIGLKSYLFLVIFLLPDLISILLPICLLIAGIQVYQKLIADNEMLVLRSVGYSNIQIARPFLSVGVVLTVLTLLSNIFLIPESFKKFRSFEHQIKNELSSSVIQPGAFNAIKGATVYVQERSLSGQLKGIFIHQSAENGKLPFVITAETGQLIKKDNMLNLLLFKGNRQEWNKDTEKLSFFYFENCVYDLNILLPQAQPRPKKPYERSLSELLNPESLTQDNTIKQRMIIEGHQRILLPWLCIINALVVMSILLFGDLKRRQRKRKIIISICVAAAIQIALIILLNMSVKIPSLLWVTYGFIFFSIVLFSALLRMHNFNKK
jgi:lipopolysaccharide export system permease protein